MKTTVKILACATVIVGMAVVASATNIDCAGPGASQVTVPDVTTGLGPGLNTCSVIGSPFIFSNFGISASGAVAGATIGIASPFAGTGVVGSETDLVFQISGAGAGNGDIELYYEVTGASLDGLDLNFQATPLGNGSGSITITEIACSQAFTNSVCDGTTFANFSATSNGSAAENSVIFDGGPETTVYIKKDISFSNATMSEFENSQLLGTVPEPMTLSMLGVGLLGLGLVGRKLRK